MGTPNEILSYQMETEGEAVVIGVDSLEGVAEGVGTQHRDPYVLEYNEYIDYNIDMDEVQHANNENMGTHEGRIVESAFDNEEERIPRHRPQPAAVNVDLGLCDIVEQSKGNDTHYGDSDELKKSDKQRRMHCY
ncbi:hypothetical protein Adt_21102 [Abeliophyllum distichum]|uniref:Uncharacterized protein n=1 Tax=Abeliophyllum distichum TaxID=126358 RepID=A0ABD1SYL9_9LAMI